MVALSVLAKIEIAGWIGGPCSTTFPRSSVERSFALYVCGSAVSPRWPFHLLELCTYPVTGAGQVRVRCRWRSSCAAGGIFCKPAFCFEPTKRAARHDQFAWQHGMCKTSDVQCSWPAQYFGDVIDKVPVQYLMNLQHPLAEACFTFCARQIALVAALILRSLACISKLSSRVGSFLLCLSGPGTGRGPCEE